MSRTQTNRNDPCHCGSGHKYKKCCLPKEEGARIMSNGRLKNEFRDEVKKEQRIREAECVICRKLLLSVMPPVPTALLKLGVCSFDCKDALDIKNETERVGEAEMLHRDQFATMIQLRLQKKMRDKDVAYTKAAIEDYEYLIDELAKLPLSQARVGMTKIIKKQVGNLVTQAAQGVFPRPNEVTLAALEVILEKPKPAGEIISPEPKGANDKDDELVGPEDDEL